MAVPACLRLADDVFPRVRADAARRLSEGGWSQTRIAQALGLSQAMVSKHLAAPVVLDAMASHLAADLVQEILDPQPAAGPSAWCATLSIGQDRAGASAALADLLAAEAMLLKQPPLRLMPQVGLNIARALPDASGPQDVLAFPGRLVEAGGRVVRPAPPAFGGSSHLARLLLAAPAAQAVANVRGGSDVAAACRRLGWKLQPVARNGKTSDPDAAILRVLSAKPGVSVVHDPGAIGLEPCLYLFGRDATAVARSILLLHEALVTP